MERMGMASKKKSKETTDSTPDVSSNGAMPVVYSSQTENSIREKHDTISLTDTPAYYVKERQGFDYVEEGYMRHLLNKHFPIWNWEIIKYELLGSEWIVVQGRLTIHDNGVTRKYDSVSSHRIQKRRDSDEFVDIGNDIKAANTDAFKVAVNRLCNISDDVYRKRIESMELTDKQAKYIMELAKKSGMQERIEKAIAAGKVHRHNASRTITQLKESVSGEHSMETTG